MIANFSNNMIEPLNRLGESLDTLRSSFLPACARRINPMYEPVF
jgi:hypothetical protein